VVSVNDAFRHGGLGKSHQRRRQAALPVGLGRKLHQGNRNGNADLSAGTLGVRSKRYSMMVEDGKVTALNIEDAPGQAVTSGASALLEQL
jgi:peroxiredoxin